MYHMFNPTPVVNPYQCLIAKPACVRIHLCVYYQARLYWTMQTAPHRTQRSPFKQETSRPAAQLLRICGEPDTF